VAERFRLFAQIFAHKPPPLKDLLGKTQSFAFILIGLQYNVKSRSGTALASNSESGVLVYTECN
jgi:hypothetical protein